MSFRGGPRKFNKFNKRSGFSGTRNRNHEPQNQDKCNKFISQERLTESEVGITEYVSSVPGFSGIIKARFSDFHVNEINLSGEVAKLTDISVPANFNFDPILEEGAAERPTDLISSENWTKLDEIVTSEQDLGVVEIDVTALSKEERTRIHESVKRVFGQKIVASTKSLDDKKSIQFKKYVKGEKKDMRWCWPKDKGEYVYFLVYKEVMDTIETAFKLTDCLRMKSSMVSYAGVKDRRAKTTQWFCIKKIDPRKLINKSRYLRNIHVGNITFRDKPLKLGQLSGNRFKIALRNISADDDLINQAMESLKNNGFINYYGLQRFGNDKEVPTFEIGVKLLQGNWKDACDLILKVKSSEDPQSDIVKAKRVYKQTSNSELACKEFSKNYNKCVESKLLMGFVKHHEHDYVNALENVPRNMRLLYIHAFQSLVWNKVASKRIVEYGLKPIVGDIVLLSEKTVEEDTDDAKETVDAEAEETNDDEEPNNKTITPKIIQEIKILTEDHLNDYTIYDIVLPLPGYDVKYPENKFKDYYKEILEEHNLTLEMPKQKVKTYTLSGDYRKLLGQVKNLSWKTMMYNHPNDTLILSDYEELKGYPEPENDPNGQYKALVIDLCLNSSCYATMVLREFLKIDTSTAAHAKLNNYHEGNTGKDFAKANSLLSDAAKYEAFKQQIFGGASDDLKRKTDEENGELNVSKKMKIMENEESAIKIQPSLV